MTDRLAVCESALSVATRTSTPFEGSPCAPGARAATSRSRVPSVVPRSNTTRLSASDALDVGAQARTTRTGKAETPGRASTVGERSIAIPPDACSAPGWRCEGRTASTGRAAPPAMIRDMSKCWFLVTPERRSPSPTSTNTSSPPSRSWAAHSCPVRSSITSTTSGTTTARRTSRSSPITRLTWPTTQRRGELLGPTATVASMNGPMRMCRLDPTGRRSACSVAGCGHGRGTPSARNASPNMEREL